jgi:molybdopterin synthase catalytic subunit/molybdopterin converting factor small subunit
MSPEPVAASRGMRVRVRLFAGLRERVGMGENELELPAGARARDVWDVLELGPEPPGLAYAINRQYVDRDHGLEDGDELAIIPPVSGGSFRLVEGPIDVQAVLQEVETDEAGAIASFVGTVRARSRDREVVQLEYEAYEGMAEEVMGQLAAALKVKYDLCEVAITHRVGRVEVGEASVAIAVSAPHRRDALAACADAIDTLKNTVPLWKKEVYEGGEEWIGRGS